MSKTNPKPADEEAEPRAPTELGKALARSPMAKAQWSDLTPIARRDFISWIDAAKQPMTRKRRIEKACSMLADGKRRPCCYSIVSLDLHQALSASPRAKAQWGDLTSSERRDFIHWMDSAKEPEAHGLRIKKACAMLAAGKRHALERSLSKPEVGKETKSPRFNSVEAYFIAQEPAKARTLRSVIDVILREFPGLECTVAWNVPQIHRDGKYVAGVAAFKHHLTFAPWSPRVIKDFKARLKKFVVKANCFQIPIDWEIDRQLLKDLVQARLAELD